MLNAQLPAKRQGNLFGGVFDYEICLTFAIGYTILFLNTHISIIKTKNCNEPQVLFSEHTGNFY